MSEKISYADFRAALPAEKRRDDPLYTRLLLRPLSISVGWWLARLGMSGNAVSLTALFVALIGCALLAVPSSGPALTSWALGGALLLNLAAFLDCIDGNIARAMRQTGPGGEWIDAIVGYTVYAGLPLALGLHVGIQPDGTINGWPVLLGAVASTTNLLARLMHQKHESAFGRRDVRAPGNRVAYLAKRLSGETGFVGMMMPALVLVLLIGQEIVYLAAYAALYTVMLAGVAALRIKQLFGW